MVKRISTCFLTLLFLAGMIGSAAAADLAKTLTEGMQTLQASKGDADLLAITNAPYLRLKGKSMRENIGVIEKVTGCSLGSDNMLFLDKAPDNLLRVMLFSKKNGKAVFIGEEAGGGLFSEPLVITREALLGQKFWIDSLELRMSKDLPAYAPLALVWAEDVPYLYLKSAERHGDICPGITAGYMIASYVIQHYPLHSGEAYYYVSAPAWCKDDAIPVVLGITPGKGNVVVKHLSEEQLGEISIPKPSGFILIWDNDKKTGKGVALNFDFNTAKDMVPEGAGNRKVAMTLIMTEFLNEPEHFVSVPGEFTLNEQLFNQMLQAGTNPYKLTGFDKKEKKEEKKEEKK